MSNIKPLGDPARHFWMTRSVARKIGVSLSEALVEGKLSQKGYADLVTRCRQCQSVKECEQWLAQPDQFAECVPDHCQHAALFDSLKDVARKA